MQLLSDRFLSTLKDSYFVRIWNNQEDPVRSRGLGDYHVASFGTHGEFSGLSKLASAIPAWRPTFPA